MFYMHLVIWKVLKTTLNSLKTETEHKKNIQGNINYTHDQQQKTNWNSNKKSNQTFLYKFKAFGTIFANHVLKTLKKIFCNEAPKL